jgi:hypothetical protein
MIAPIAFKEIPVAAIAAALNRFSRPATMRRHRAWGTIPPRRPLSHSVG